MAQRILIFENDADFAGELRSGFEQYGAEVEVVNDGPTGLERAADSRPDLILLTIELPGMNGFLVCKKIKKSAGLQDIPLVILSSEASEETFEQHRKLRTHAEDYLHKPILFAELLERVQALVPIGPTDEEEIEEFLELDDEDTTGVVAEDSITPEVLSETDDVEQLEDDAVESLEVDGEEEIYEIEEEESVTGVSPEPPPPPEPELPPPPAPEPVAGAGASADAAQEQIALLQQQLQEAKGRAESAERSLREAASAKADRGGGVSGREFLDLKEQLNRKDRELLELRDQVTARDKQLIEARDENLKIAREVADLKDSGLTMERDLGKARELSEALKADKEAAKKRNDDLKTRLERIESKSRELEQELDRVESERAKQVAELEEQINRRAAEDAEAKEAALEELRGSLTAEMEQKLAETQSQHKAEMESAQQAHENELKSTRESLEERHETDIRERDEKYASELAAANQSLAEAESKLTQVEEKLERIEETNRSLEESLNKVTEERNERSAELLSARDAVEELGRAKQDHEQRISELENKLAQASQKIAGDEQLLERVRKAMAIGLGLLEEQKQNQFEN